MTEGGRGSIKKLLKGFLPAGLDPFDVVIGTVVLSGFVAAYIAFCPEGLGWGDSNELLYGLKNFQIVHPPGYPTYLMLGRAFLFVCGLSAVPAGHWFSGMGTASGLLILFLFLRRRGMNRMSSLIPVLLLGVSFPIWQFSTKAEVYGLTLFFFSGSLLLWNEVQRTGRGMDLLCLWTGLSLTHHPTGLVSLALTMDAMRARSWSIPFRRSVLVCLPGLAYFTLLLPHGGFPFNWPEPGHMAALWDHMLGGNFRQFFLLHGLWTPLSQTVLALYAHLLTFPFLIAVLWIAGYVKARGVEKRLIPIQLGFLSLLVLYDVPDLYDFFVFSYAIGVVFVARSIQWIHDHSIPAVMIGVYLLLFGSVAGAGWWLNLPYGETRRPRADEYVQQASNVLEEGMILCDWDHYTALRYHQLERGKLKRVQLLALTHLRPLWNEIIRSHYRRGISVYSTLKLGDLPSGWEQIPRGPLYEIRPQVPDTRSPGSSRSAASKPVHLLREARTNGAEEGADLPEAP